MLSCLWLWFSEGRLRQRAVELQPLADEHDLLEVKIQAEKKALEAAVQTNQAMARAMADVRSSSALLAELQRLVPQSISLDQAQINGDALNLSGEALMPDGLRTLNALMLSLGQSALFDEDGVTLQQASLQRSASSQTADQGRLSYGLSARASDAPQAIRPQLACPWGHRSGAAPAAFAAGGGFVRMTNFSGIGRQGLWSWLTPERAVLVVPVFAGLGLSMALLSVGITPLTIRVREQSEVVEQLTTKAEFVPVLRQQLAAVKREQAERDQQLDRLLDLVAGTSELQTFLAGSMIWLASTTCHHHHQAWGLERFKHADASSGQDCSTRSRWWRLFKEGRGDPLLNRGLEKRSAALTVTGPFQQVLAFLQSLEQLEVFVVISEMNVQSRAAAD